MVFPVASVVDAPVAVGQFEAKMERALERVKAVLDANRAPCWASEVHHQYVDKYLLAQCMTNTWICSQVNCLNSMGLTQDKIRQLCEWSKTSALSLKFRSEEHCSFLREETREVESGTKHVEEVSVVGAVVGAIRSALTSKVVTTVTEYFWSFEVTYELTAIRGVGQNAEDRLPMLNRTGRVEIKTTTKSSPHPESKVPAAEFEVNMTWLTTQLHQESLVPCLRIDRDNAKCHTPCRNPEIKAAQQYCQAFAAWTLNVCGYASRLLAVQPDPMIKPDLSSVDSAAVFQPILPLFDDSEHVAVVDGTVSLGFASAAAAAEVGVVGLLSATEEPVPCMLLATDSINSLLIEEIRTLSEKSRCLKEAFQHDGIVATAAEAVLVVTLEHCADVCQQWAMALKYIEGMLRAQLIAAIGKEVTPADFSEYMRFHYRKLFADRYLPTPFCFAVRRSDRHSPEGTVSIEQEGPSGGGESSIAEPIMTMVARAGVGHQMMFPLSASVNVRFGGDKYLHAWLAHQFSDQTGAQISLTSRARQFSSMIVLVGRIASAQVFEPKYAAIVKNKDELKIPLDLSTIPTPQEFKDAIESLSPEQQDFAKAFRSMQLESTLFGVLVIQIKPQLEKVLNLEYDSLTKEIKLTQDLMSLFIDYQIPCDLLSFDAIDSETGVEIVTRGGSDKLEVVKAHVMAMKDIIEREKEEEIQQRKMEEEFRRRKEEEIQHRRMEEETRRSGAVRERRRSKEEHMSKGLKKKCGARSGRVAAPASSAMPSAPPAASSASPPSQQHQETCSRGDALHEPSYGQIAAATEETCDAPGRDYTKVPQKLDERFEQLDTDSAVRPTIIAPSEVWTKQAQKALLATPSFSILDADSQKKEKDAAFDLLDALTKSGAIPVERASLHIVVAATHCFDKTVTETVIQESINPIEKVERSALIMATTIHQQPASALIREAQFVRVRDTSPALFLDDV